MKGLSEHDQVEAAVRGGPALESADLDGEGLGPCDLGHARIWLNRKHIGSPLEELLRRDPGTRPNIEHRLRPAHQKVVDEFVRITGPTLVIDLRCGTERVRTGTVEVEICMWLHTEILRAA